MRIDRSTPGKSGNRKLEIHMYGYGVYEDLERFISSEVNSVELSISCYILSVVGAKCEQCFAWAIDKDAATPQRLMPMDRAGP